MPRKFTDAFLDHARDLLATQTITEVARTLGCAPDNLSRLLRAQGVQTRGLHARPAPNRIDLPDEVSKLFAEGWSVKRLAERFNVTRFVVCRELIKRGIKPRNRSEGMLVRMSHMTERERGELTAAAHNAVRGKPRARETKLKNAQARCRIVGEGEEILKQRFTELRIPFDAQAPIDIYNIDLLVDGIAVEPSCSTVSTLYRKKHSQRTKVLNDLGVCVFVILYARIDALVGNMHHIIADLDELRSQPPAQRQNRVVWCGADRFTMFRNDRGQISSEPAPIRFRYETR